MNRPICVWTMTVLVGAGVPSASAQRCGWSVDVTPVVSPRHPTAHIRVHAWFDRIPGQAELFYTGMFDLRANVPAFTGFSGVGGIESPDPRIFPFEPMAISRVRVTQIHLPPGLVGNPAIPIKVFQAWWEPEEFTPRIVTISVEPTPGQPMYVYKSLATRDNTDYPAAPEAGQVQVRVGCYADCDSSTGVDRLDIFDFLCFQNYFVTGHTYACDCDTSPYPGVCNIFDFICFQNEFVGGCP